MAASADEGLGRQIERRSIDYVPEDERHGKVWHQGPFWFLGDFQLPGREVPSDPEENLAEWKCLQEGLSVRITLLEELPPLGMVVVWITGFLGRAKCELGVEFLAGATAGVGLDSEIVQREVFGPVVTVQRFDDDDEAISWANDVAYGVVGEARDGEETIMLAARLQPDVILMDLKTVDDQARKGLTALISAALDRSSELRPGIREQDGAVAHHDRGKPFTE